MTVHLEDTGERMVPELHVGKNIYGAHIGRYMVAERFVKDKVVLDIACGSGYGSSLIAENAKEVIGVDIDEETIAYAKENFGKSNVTYKVGSGESIPLEDGTIDVVVSYETIEHIADYRKFLAEIKRVMKPGGVLLISTPNDAEYIEDNHFHLHEFQYKELVKTLKPFFKYHQDYFQTLWLYSSIFPLKLQTSTWTKPLLTTQTLKLRPEQSIYYLLVCSDKPIKTEVEPRGVIGEHYRLVDVQRANKKMHDKHQALMEYKQKALESEPYRKELELIYSSRSWKLAKRISRVAGYFRRVRR